MTESPRLGPRADRGGVGRGGSRCVPAARSSAHEASFAADCARKPADVQRNGLSARALSPSRRRCESRAVPLTIDRVVCAEEDRKDGTGMLGHFTVPGHGCGLRQVAIGVKWAGAAGAARHLFRGSPRRDVGRVKSRALSGAGKQATGGDGRLAAMAWRPERPQPPPRVSDSSKVQQGGRQRGFRDGGQRTAAAILAKTSVMTASMASPVISPTSSGGAYSTMS